MSRLILLYFGFYFAFGSGIIYFIAIFTQMGISNSTSGLIFSIGSLIGMVLQPVFGMIADKTRKDKNILFFTMSIIGLVAILFFFVQNTVTAFLVYPIFYMSCSVMMPLMDGLAVSSKFSFGNIRLWGSVGFATGSLVSGKIISLFGNSSFLIVVFIAAIFTNIIILKLEDIEIKDHEKAHINDVKELIHNKNFVLFTLFSILVAGTNITHNVFFKEYFSNIGGSAAYLGLIIFLMTLSEVPIMRLAGKLVEKFGSKNLILISGLMLSFRWLLFYLLPIPTFIASIFFLQGISSGLYYGVASNHAKAIVSKKVISTAVTIILAAGTFGSIFTQWISGKISTVFGINYIYLLMAGVCLAGSIFLFFERANKKALKKI
ncbi:MAG: MFS transporter [Fusobacteriaceae bacterium]